MKVLSIKYPGIFFICNECGALVGEVNENEIYEDCYGPQMYYIKKQPVTTFEGLETIENNYITFRRALKDLAERKITGNNALNYITNMFS